jgi:hypothetical protein
VLAFCFVCNHSASLEPNKNKETAISFWQEYGYGNQKFLRIFAPEITRIARRAVKYLKNRQIVLKFHILRKYLVKCWENACLITSTNNWNIVRKTMRLATR